jgi:alpha-pyrone synthase
LGCHGALNGLRVARAFADADPGAVVLVCAVELCSLHFHYTSDPEKMVANALFADGAAAVVVKGGPSEKSGLLRIASCGSCLVPQSKDAMTWTIGDHGFEMTLSPEVPAILERHLRGWAGEWLGSCGLKVGDIGSWAVHPGGPRVIFTVARCLDLPDAAVEVSRSVLADHGNMSSPTVLFIIDRLLRAGAKRPIAAMAFGPGLTAEGVLLA